jgi:hypothetical protein
MDKENIHMKKIEDLFKEGYVNKHHINPKYVGLVGWAGVCAETQYQVDEDYKCTPFELKAKINGDYIDEYGDKVEYFKIPQFTPAEIPIGELCWVMSKIWNEDEEQWVRKVFKGYTTPGHCYPFEYEDGTFSSTCVPTFIAEDKETAELMKDWSK